MSFWAFGAGRCGGTDAEEGPGGTDILALAPGCSANGARYPMLEEGGKPSHSLSVAWFYLITYFQCAPLLNQQR